MTEQTKPDHTPARPPRRRFTPAERIANRQAEIERIKEQERQAVREAIDELVASLAEAELRAASAGMTSEADRIHGAREALEPE